MNENATRKLELFKKILSQYPNISANQYDKLRIRNKPGRNTLRRAFGCSWNELRKKCIEPNVAEYSEIENKESVDADYKKDTGTVEINSFRPITLEDAIRIGNIDLETWEIDRYKSNAWEVTMKLRRQSKDGNIIHEPYTKTNFQMTLWLKRKITEPLEDAIKGLIKSIPSFTPPKNFIRRTPKSDFALEMALYDAHLGKLAWGNETDKGDYDLKIATTGFVKACELNLNYSSNFKISQIIFPLGQDFMHVENYAGQTPLGKINLDTDSRLPKIYQKAKESFIKAVYLCRSVAPVKILWVPGNHDIHASYYMSDVVKEHFRKDKFVEVDNSPPWRKAVLWGKLLVGYTHDANIRQTNVINMLPQFWPNLWAESKYREWHTGHRHKKEETKYRPTLTAGGVIIRQIPTLSAIDAWHYQEGFVDGVPAGESLIWSKENGVCGHFTAFVKSNKFTY